MPSSSCFRLLAHIGQLVRNATPSSLEERDKVGTIEIVINKADEFKYTHPHGALLPDGLPKDWAESPAKPVKGQIHPTLHITFVDHLVPLRTLTTYRFPEAGKRMSEADRCGTRERMRRLRQGPEPWVSFKFIYRERGKSESPFLQSYLAVVKKHRIPP